MRKPVTIVTEDMIISDHQDATHHFTGGKSKLNLPFTISFFSEGDYEVFISKDKVVVKAIKDNEDLEE